MRLPDGRLGIRRTTAIAVLVIGGLAASILAGVFLIPRPTVGLPGVALQSGAVLVVERISVLFAAWLLGLVVVFRAVSGELPTEVSGRGVRYAEADTSQTELAVSQRAFRDLDQAVKFLAKRVLAVEQREEAEDG